MTKIVETSVRDCPVEGCEWPNNGPSGPKYDCGLRRMAALGAHASVSQARELGCGYVKASMWRWADETRSTLNTEVSSSRAGEHRG